MKVVDRAVQMLEVLSRNGSGLGVMKLAEAVSAPPSTVHRLLSVLVRHRLVTQDSDSRRYRLGPGVLPLSESFVQSNPIISTAQPYLDAVRSRMLESVFLTEYVEGEAICVATAESPRPLRFFMRVGQRMPYHAAASARAILAFRPREEARGRLEHEALQQFTSSTPTTQTAVLRELDRVRAQGYATCDEEMEVGVTALSVPILNGIGEAIASVSVVGPHARLAGEHRRAIIEQLREQAEAISSALGHRTGYGHRVDPELRTTTSVSGS